MQLQSVSYAAVMALVIASGASAQTTRSGASGPATAQGQGVPLRGFGVTLVLGDTKAGPSSDVPPPAAKALADLKDFLPYKSFKVLDTQWTAGNDKVGSNGMSRLRLRAPNDTSTEYDLVIFSQQDIQGSTLVLRVQLARVPLPSGTDKAAPVVSLVETSVTMQVGETTVVGSSRAQGETALILLLTAVPSQGR